MTKKLLILIMIIALLCVFSACPANGDQNSFENEDNQPEQEEITKMYITIYGNKLEVTLENNASVKALVELLKQGDITYTAADYGGFEKVGYIGHSLPTNDTHVTTQSGDVVLYQSNQICIMVGSNSWSYTRIGKINGYSSSQLKKIIGITGNDSAEVTLSLN